MKKLMVACIIIFCIPALGIGQDFKIKQDFGSGEVIRSDDFNQNFTAIEREINALRKELDAIKSEMDPVPSPSIVHTKSWKIEKRESGTATDWSNLPTEMALSITTERSTLFITADISRTQHSDPNKNTEYRIAIESKKTLMKKDVARTNTGNHAGWAFGPLTMHAATEVEPGDYTVRVQYKTQSGTEYWHDDTNGHQFRSITVLEVPIQEEKPKSE